MFGTMMNDRKRQEDEVVAISSIYDENMFSTIDEQIKCTLNVSLTVPQKLEIKVADHSNETSVAIGNKIFVEHLSPATLDMHLPNTYPSQKPPIFRLSVPWLPLWEISFLCQKLDEIWEENKGNEILFLWIDFLHNDLFNFLGIKDSLDVSFMHMVHLTPQDYVNSHLAYLCDSRAINDSLFLNPIEFLTSYNKSQCQVQFNKKSYTCDICFDKYMGLKCVELKNCGHVYCKNCIKEYIRVKITENNEIILCPTFECKCRIDVNDIKTFCPHLFPRYEKLALRIALDTMEDVVYCPRISCQYPVIRNLEDVAMCPICSYCFCIFCHKVYHGITPCEMSSRDFQKLIDKYKNSNDKQKKLLEKKYGKLRIQLVEKHLTTKYLQDNAKSCPSCRTFIIKSDGCNKMTCTHCQSYFCWLCGHKIISTNAYEHFKDKNSPCFGRLFEGAVNIDYDVMHNIAWFDQNF
ncbi:PREDICTED: E3 ubiquitin-protein ligase RNF14-like [Dinoponera quadriceps]|uniref:RBR-type E3 ubiquitin transferase n=1 Tax=Dinoponera quadriceps TaxID=609295 RepID=A0A6P3XZH0_DINQU|nr:PREDICTED: E3 ubiquitin-protein ligase RNF14-like [Dinoponera quadriceps]XP_014483373.1 PREDICTED: E3 ubiquitin-protein ligase RNF14-like [Dinoponera quadriceps]XP_014483374.1 PREDICTED: E3 ubiquitin-protein ligase RNF14-like [Dinoponera quadriceps]